MKKKLNEWYDEDALPSLGILSYNKFFSACQTKMLDAGLSDCKWAYAETEIAADALMSVLRVPRSDTFVRQPLVAYLSGYVTHFVTLSDINKICMVTTGWHHEFKAGKLFVPWSGTVPVWAALYVETTKHAAVRGKPFELHTCAIAGPASGCKMIRRVDTTSARMLYKALISYQGDLVSDPPNPLFLGGMYFFALLFPGTHQVEIRQAFATQTQKEFNKELMELRKKPCMGPWDTGNSPCTEYCPVARDECILSTHADKRVKAQCKNITIPHQGWIMNSGYCSKCLREHLVSFEDDYID